MLNLKYSVHSINYNNKMESIIDNCTKTNASKNNYAK